MKVTIEPIPPDEYDLKSDFPHESYTNSYTASFITRRKVHKMKEYIGYFESAYSFENTVEDGTITIDFYPEECWKEDSELTREEKEELIDEHIVTVTPMMRQDNGQGYWKRITAHDEQGYIIFESIGYVPRRFTNAQMEYFKASFTRTLKE